MAESGGSVRKVFGLAKKKETKSIYSYEIVTQDGVRDGVLLGPGELFSRSWKLLNTSPASKSKEKDRVKPVKLVQESGHPMLEYLFFIYPLPNQTVTLTLELNAPTEIGWYESYWCLEGEEESKFWVKFEVVDFGIPKPALKKAVSSGDRLIAASAIKKNSQVLPGSMSPSTKAKKGKVIGAEQLLKKFSKELSMEPEPSSLTLETTHSKARKEFTEEDSTSEATGTPTRRKRKGSTSSRKKTSRQNSNSITFGERLSPVYMSKDKDKGNSLDKINRKRSNSGSNLASSTEKKKRKRKKQSKEKKIEPDSKATSTRRKATPHKTRTISYDNEKIEAPVIDLVKETPLTKGWKHQVLEQESQKAKESAESKQLSMHERALSLKNIHMMKKRSFLGDSDYIDSAPFEELCVDSQLTVSVHSAQDPIPHQPDTELISDVAKTMLEIKKLTEHLAITLEQSQIEFSTDEKISSLAQDTSVHLTSFMIPFEKQVKKFNRVARTARNIYLVAKLPAKIWVKIFTFLTPFDICQVSRTCSFWNGLSLHQSIWKEKYDALRIVPTESSFATEGLRYQALYKLEKAYRDWYLPDDSTVLSGDLIFQPEGIQKAPVFALDTDKDSLVTVSDAIRVFDVYSKKLRATMTGHEKLSPCVKLGVDGNTCITGSLDKTVKLWSLSEYKCIKTFTGHTGGVNSVAEFGDIIISTSTQDKTIRFWNVETGENIHSIESKVGVSCLAVNLTSTAPHVYFGTLDGKVVQWDIVAEKAMYTEPVTVGVVEGLQVFGEVMAVSDYTRVTVKSQSDSSLACISPMGRNIGRLCYDGYRLGAKVGNQLHSFDLRYLFTQKGTVTVDPLWKGAFTYIGDSVLIGSGTGCVYDWKPR